MVGELGHVQDHGTRRGNRWLEASAERAFEVFEVHPNGD